MGWPEYDKPLQPRCTCGHLLSSHADADGAPCTICPKMGGGCKGYTPDEDGHR